MKADILDIQGRQRKNLMVPLSLADFQIKKSGSISASELIDSPEISLCCLDDVQQRFIFAEVPQDVDPSQAAFFYLSQFEQATRLYALSYEDGISLAQGFQPATSRLLFIHNIGRCGSTLLHRAFGNMTGVISLSEPDCIGNLRYLRSAAGHEDARLEQVLRSSLKLLLKPANTKGKILHQGIIKLRNQSINDLGFIVKAFPEAKHLFLYRSLKGWVSSIYSRRLNRQDALTRDQQNVQTYFERYHNKAIDLSRYGPLPDRLSVVEELTLAWFIMIDHYQACYQDGLRMPALRYEELNQQREPALSWLLNYLELNANLILEALTAFSEDSQAGTRMARVDPTKGSDIHYSDRELAQMQTLLQQHANIKHFDVKLEGTFSL